jgi:hypothetical protein
VRTRLSSLRLGLRHRCRGTTIQSEGEQAYSRGEGRARAGALPPYPSSQSLTPRTPSIGYITDACTLHRIDYVVIPIVIPYYSSYLYSTLNLPYMTGLINLVVIILHPLVLASQPRAREPHPLTRICFIPCLACLCAGLFSRTLAITPYPTCCVGLSTYVIKSSCSFCSFHQSFYSCLLKVLLLKFFTPPPWVLSPIFSFFSLSYFFDYPFHLPDLLQPACFPCLLTLFVCSLCLYHNLHWLCQLNLKLV